MVVGVMGLHEILLIKSITSITSRIVFEIQYLTAFL